MGPRNWADDALFKARNGHGLVSGGFLRDRSQHSHMAKIAPFRRDPFKRVSADGTKSSLDPHNPGCIVALDFLIICEAGRRGTPSRMNGAFDRRSDRSFDHSNGALFESSRIKRSANPTFDPSTWWSDCRKKRISAYRRSARRRVRAGARGDPICENHPVFPTPVQTGLGIRNSRRDWPPRLVTVGECKSRAAT